MCSMLSDGPPITIKNTGLSPVKKFDIGSFEHKLLLYDVTRLARIEDYSVPPVFRDQKAVGCVAVTVGRILLSAHG